MTTRSIGLLVLGVLLGCAAHAHAAESYPSKPVRIVVGFPPGGFVDFTARLIAAPLSSALAQQFVVDNRAGAGGTVGAEAAVRAAPDGYTIIMVSSSYATNAALYKLPYDPVTGIAPVTPVGKTAELLLVHPSLPVKSLQQLIDLARAKPKALNYGSSGVGGFTHLETELFNQMANVQTTHVPYKGTGLALTDIVAGQIQLLFASAPSSLPFAKQGRLRALGVASTKRMAVAPDLPAIAEVVPGYSAELWYGVWAPPGTPRAIVDRLNQAIARAVQSPEIRDRLAADFGIEATHSTPEEFAKFIGADIGKWKRVVANGNIKLD